MLEPIRATVIQMMPQGLNDTRTERAWCPDAWKRRTIASHKMYAGGPVVNAFQDPPEMPPGNAVLAGVGVRAEEEEAPHR